MDAERKVCAMRAMVLEAIQYLWLSKSHENTSSNGALLILSTAQPDFGLRAETRAAAGGTRVTKNSFPGSEVGSAGGRDKRLRFSVAQEEELYGDPDAAQSVARSEGVRCFLP